MASIGYHFIRDELGTLIGFDFKALWEKELREKEAGPQKLTSWQKYLDLLNVEEAAQAKKRP